MLPAATTGDLLNHKEIDLEMYNDFEATESMVQYHYGHQ